MAPSHAPPDGRWLGSTSSDHLSDHNDRLRLAPPELRRLRSPRSSTLVPVVADHGPWESQQPCPTATGRLCPHTLSRLWLFMGSNFVGERRTGATRKNGQGTLLAIDS